MRYNLIAIWGALGGLAAGLWVMSGRQTIPARVWLGRAIAIGLIVFAGLAHAQSNADLIGADWVVPALAIPRLLTPLYWLWPLAILAIAMIVDWRVLRTLRANATLDALRLGPDRGDVSNLLGLAVQQPPVSTRSVWSFVTTRRALMFTVARNGCDPAAAPAEVSSGLAKLLAPLAAQLERQSRNDGDLWAEVAAAWRHERRVRWSAWFRSSRGRLFGGVSAVLALVPMMYFVVGTNPGGYDLQRWMSRSGSAATVAVAVVGVGLGVVVAALRVRAFRRTPEVMAEPKAQAALALAVSVGVIGSMLYGLFEIRSGVGLDTRVYTAHGLAALGSLLWSAALNLGLLTLVAVNPMSGWPQLVEHHRFKSSDELLAMLPMELQILVHVGHTVVAADGRAVPGEWEEGPKPPSPLDAELDAIIEHAWDSHVASDPSEFPEVRTPEEMKELLEEIIDKRNRMGLSGRWRRVLVRRCDGHRRHQEPCGDRRYHLSTRPRGGRMMSGSSPLHDDVPEMPAELGPAMSEAEEAAKAEGGWRRGYPVSGALRKWAQTIDSIGDYRLHGSDDYQHLLSYRVVLHYLLVALRDLGHGDALTWLQVQVDGLDREFVQRSADDAEGLITRSDRDNPDFWFLRRLPNDRNVVEHLRMIQPKMRSEATQPEQEREEAGEPELEEEAEH